MEQKDEWEIKLSAKFDNKPHTKLYKHFSEDDYTIDFVMAELCLDFLKHCSFSPNNKIKEEFIKTIKEEF